MNFSNDEVSGVYTFLRSTPEAHLKGMLINDALPEDHFKLLIKMARTCSEEDFSSGFQAETFPGIRLKAPEIKIQENFWALCKRRFADLGFLNSKAA